jgi:hypothetical protein
MTEYLKAEWGSKVEGRLLLPARGQGETLNYGSIGTSDNSPWSY